MRVSNSLLATFGFASERALPCLAEEILYFSMSVSSSLMWVAQHLVPAEPVGVPVLDYPHQAFPGVEEVPGWPAWSASVTAGMLGQTLSLRAREPQPPG